MRGPFAEKGRRRYAAGRCCDAAGCDTVLSIYNGSKYCSVHLVDRESAPRKQPHNTVEYAANGDKICTACRKALPLTEKYWYRRRERNGEVGWQTQCKACIPKRRLQKCPDCGTVNPMNDERLWRPDGDRASGWALRCRVCEVNRWKEQRRTQRERYRRKVAADD